MFDEFRSRLRLNGTLTFTVRVRTQAEFSAFREVMDDGAVKIDLAAMPEDGRANEELVRFLAQEFETPRSLIEIVSGLTSRTKIVKIRKDGDATDLLDVPDLF